MFQTGICVQISVGGTNLWMKAALTRTELRFIPLFLLSHRRSLPSSIALKRVLK